MPVELAVYILTAIVLFLMGGIEQVSRKYNWEMTQRLCEGLWLFVLLFSGTIVRSIGSLLISNDALATTFGWIVVCVSGLIAFLAGSFTAFMMQNGEFANRSSK